MPDPIRSEPETLADAFDRVARDLRERARLAGREAREAWDRAHLDRVKDEIERTRDELRLKAHLAKLDAKSAWDQIEKRLDALRDRAGSALDTVTGEIADAATDLARALRRKEDGEHREPSAPRR